MAMTSSAIGQVSTRNDGRRLGVALLVIATAQLMAARAVQGAAGAIVAPTALALIATTFPDGPARNRAMGCTPG
jgi:MFS family permease